MNTQELEAALLLRDSGELSDTQSRELDAFLSEHPESVAVGEELRMLQDAGRFASREVVPPLSELTMERIRSAAPPVNRKRLPRFLAIAAGLILAVALWPLIRPPSPVPAHLTVSTEESFRLEYKEDDLLEDLQDLEEELAVWTDASANELLILGEEDVLAEFLLHTEESI